LSSQKEEKQRLRSLFLKKRESLNEILLEELSNKISQKILESHFWQDYSNFAFYMAKGKEASLIKLVGITFLVGKKAYLPKTWLKEKRLTFHRVYSLSDLVPGPFGILEPTPMNEEVSVNSLDVIFIPGIAFDHKGFRLGYGGGFYDRVLRDTKAFKIGVCYSFQLVESLPVEPHDVPVDFIFTEDGSVQCQMLWQKF